MHPIQALEAALNYCTLVTVGNLDANVSYTQSKNSSVHHPKLADGSFASTIRPLSRSNMFPAPERGTEGSDRQCRGTIPFGGQPQCTVTTKYRSQGVETHAHWTCSSANNHVASFRCRNVIGELGITRLDKTGISHACGSTAQPQPYQITVTVTVRLYRSPTPYLLISHRAKDFPSGLAHTLT